MTPRRWIRRVPVRVGFGFALAAALFTAAAAQQPSAATPGAPGALAVPSSYAVGVNDVLAVSVYGAPELTDIMRVDHDGTVHIRYGHNVQVAGLNLDAIDAKVAAELVADQLAIDPRVDVSVLEVASKPITITGFIKNAITFQAIEPIRLLDALNRAGGVQEFTGAQVVVVTRAPDGSEIQRVYPAERVLSSTDFASNPLLVGGEEIRVLPGGNVYMSGAVTSQGALPLSDSDPLTVRKALARSKGTLSDADGKKAQLIHHVGTPSQTTQMINLPAIVSGRAPDIQLAANDMIYVPVSGAKRAGLEALNRTLGVITIAAGTLLVQ